MPEFYDAWDNQIPTPVVGTGYLHCLVCVLLHNPRKAFNSALQKRNAGSWAYVVHLMWIKLICGGMQSAITPIIVRGVWTPYTRKVTCLHPLAEQLAFHANCLNVQAGSYRSLVPMQAAKDLRTL